MATYDECPYCGSAVRVSMRSTFPIADESLARRALRDLCAAVAAYYRVSCELDGGGDVERRLDVMLEAASRGMAVLDARTPVAPRADGAGEGAPRAAREE